MVFGLRGGHRILSFRTGHAPNFELNGVLSDVQHAHIEYFKTSTVPTAFTEDCVVRLLVGVVFFDCVTFHKGAVLVLCFTVYL